MSNESMRGQSQPIGGDVRQSLAVTIRANAVANLGRVLELAGLTRDQETHLQSIGRTTGTYDAKTMIGGPRR